MKKVMSVVISLLFVFSTMVFAAEAPKAVAPTPVVKADVKAPAKTEKKAKKAKKKQRKPSHQ